MGALSFLTRTPAGVSLYPTTIYIYIYTSIYDSSLFVYLLPPSTVLQETISFNLLDSHKLHCVPPYSHLFRFAFCQFLGTLGDFFHGALTPSQFVLDPSHQCQRYHLCWHRCFTSTFPTMLHLVEAQHKLTG